MEKEFFQKEKFWNFNKDWDAAPITDHVIKEAEQVLEVRFPSSYLELLRIQNGGEINFPFFDYGDRLIWMDHLFGIDFNDKGLGVGILDSASLVEERSLPVPSSKVLIIWGDYHHFIALDYRNNHDHPSVIYFWETEDNGSLWGVIELAPSFDEFISKLYRRKNSIKKINYKKIYKQHVRLRYVNL